VTKEKDMSTVESVSSSQASTMSPVTGRAVGTDNPFLSLLIANLRNQTPTEPVDNSSFMNQMAQLSSMQEQKKLNDNLGDLLKFQGALARLDGLSRGAGLLGKEVEYVSEDGQTTSHGVVASVRVDDQGIVRLDLGGEEINIAQVVGIREKTTAQS
jgi:flagellar basal-body rod modification protein FlgD